MCVYISPGPTSGGHVPGRLLADPCVTARDEHGFPIKSDITGECTPSKVSPDTVQTETFKKYIGDCSVS